MFTESKTRLLHFLAHFSTNQDEIQYGIEAIETELPDCEIS